ncbi:MAG: hypothetical protein QGH07_11535 [Alphaproteobacteria bacterium]|nr:hypothetical protein [Alphaproteobacteria bacterium]
MAQFPRTHSACYGAECWPLITLLLKAAGHAVSAPNLPGHGADKTPMAALSLDLYADS